jgi:predicted RNase H-like HicB family nuclease
MKRFPLVIALAAARCATASHAPRSVATDAAANPGGRYLFVWAGDAERTDPDPDFLAILDADPASPTHGTVVTTLAVDAVGTVPHHTDHQMLPDGVLWANGFGSGDVFRFDLHRPPCASARRPVRCGERVYAPLQLRPAPRDWALRFAPEPSSVWPLERTGGFWYGSTKNGFVMRNFTAVIERDADTGLYVGWVPGFPGAHSQGETLDELRSNLQEVIEMLLEDGDPGLESEFIGVQTVEVA